MQTGIVAIGRNEGERLKQCLMSAIKLNVPTVYVDSNSTDGSVPTAEVLGVMVVNLDMTIPFTAARARNEGFSRLLREVPEIEYVQFVDGDCEINPDWLVKAVSFLEGNPEAAIVCGRRRERYPNASIYNYLCDIEWDTPIGLTQSCGGDALIRRSAFEQVHGYNPAVIAGEEPDMCFRMREAGWYIWRIEAEMTLHDAAITKFSQWWKRNYRAGHAYADGFLRHGRSQEHFRRKEIVSNFFWGSPLFWVFWPVLFVKISFSLKQIVYPFFIVLSKLPQALGQLMYFSKSLRHQGQHIIEYK